MPTAKKFANFSENVLIFMRTFPNFRMLTSNLKCKNNQPNTLGVKEGMNRRSVGCPLVTFLDSLVAQTVKHLPAMRETGVRFPGREDPLEKEMATHSSTLA